MITGKLTNVAAASVHFQGGFKHQTGLKMDIFGDKGTIVLSSPASIQFGEQDLWSKSYMTYASFYWFIVHSRIRRSRINVKVNSAPSKN